jgi:hypothetical protein
VAVTLSGIGVISIMNMEPKGLARHSFATSYVPVRDQVRALEEAVTVAMRYGLPVRLFNYPLCLLSESLREVAVKSISDWKNYYPEECNKCRLRDECGGLFSSAEGRFLEQIKAVI